MTSPDAPDLAALIRRIQETHQVTQTEIARRIGISTAAVNAWANQKRGHARGPNADRLRALASEFGIPVGEVFAAVGRKTPQPVGPDRRERVLALLAELTAEQQQWFEVQLRAVAEMNRQHPSTGGPESDAS